MLRGQLLRQHKQNARHAEKMQMMASEVLRSPTKDEAIMADKTNYVSFFVQYADQSFCFDVPKTTTMSEIKQMAFLKKACDMFGDQAHAMVGLLDAFGLQRHTGAHLDNDKTLGYYNIQRNQTLVMQAKGPGGANDGLPPPIPMSDEDDDEEIKQGMAAVKMLETACKIPGLQDAMRHQLTENYNQALAQLKAVYRERGMDPDAGNAAVASLVPIAIQETPPDEEWVEPPPDNDDDDDDDDDNDGGASQADSQAPTNVVVPQSERWRQANLHPARDPRIMKTGLQWIPDHILEECVRESDKNPFGKGNAYTLCATMKERLMGARKIDHSLSGLAGLKWGKLLRAIGIKFFCGEKQPDVIRPNTDGSVVRPLSAMLNSKPVEEAKTVTQNVIKGDPQGGKTREAILDCWAKCFIHGCLPIYYVRNSGGLNDSAEVCKDIVGFNNEIRAFCRQLKREDPRFSWLNEDEINRVTLTPRLMSDSKNNHDKQRVGLEVEPVPLHEIDRDWAEEAEQDGNGSHLAWRLTRPQVIVGLMNPASIRKFMHTGCVVKEGLSPIDLDGAGYKVNRSELGKVFTGSKKDGKMSPAKITPFSLFFGVHNVPVTFQLHGKRAAAASSGAHPGRAVLHSAYGPCCWDTSQPYDQFGNCKRGRIARLIDEIDTTTSEKKDHKVGNLTHDSADVSRMANMALDPAKYKQWCDAAASALGKDKELKRLSVDLDAARIDLDTLIKGGTLVETEAAREERANQARADRAARRADGGAAASSSTGGPHYTELDTDDEELEDDDHNNDGADEGEGGSSQGSGPDDDDEEAQERRIEQQKLKVASLVKQVEELTESAAKFRSAEEKAMRHCSGHINGMAGAAMYNVGITATIFGCMQRIKEGRVKVQTRLEKMPTPDAYNTLAKKDEVSGEWRLLAEPSKIAKKGSIKIMEAPVKRLGFFDMNSAANKNRFYEQWMLDHGHATKDAEGKVVPEEPVQPARMRNDNIPSYTIRPCWYECDEKKGESPAFPWVAEMYNDYLKAKKLQSRRMHNSWDRNEEMFKMALNELQKQRPRLKKVRRGAQGMIISGETRFTVSKDKLIADLFVRNGNEAGDAMHEVAAYNYAGERLTLYFRPENLPERLLENIIDDPDSLLIPLREYLEGDPTMHYTYPDADTTATKTKLSDTWLRSHYIAPIRDELQRSVTRHPVSAAQLAAHATAVQAAKDIGHDPPPAPRGRIKFVEEIKVAKDAVTDKEIGSVQLTRLDFMKPTPQPRLMATLFTLIDAHRFREDPDGMLPMPYVGMTKTAGGRAQRYMCHGHRSRIQVMVHTFDIFPNKRLGLAMCDAIQEGFRAAGYDEYERFGTDADRARSGCAGQWMDDWVDQVYISTKDFVPLLQNALMSMEEWVRLLLKEQSDPRRTEAEMLERYPSRTTGAESDLEYAARLKESPSETLTRVIGAEVVLCFRTAINVWVDGRPPTTNDMPYTDFPHLHKWLIAHVNRAPSTKARFLRHAVQTQSEDAIRADVEKMCRGYLDAEIDAHANGEGSDWAGVSRFENQVEQLDAEFDAEFLKTDLGKLKLKEHRDAVFKHFHGKIPLPRYSEAHAPGGDLEARDAKEAEQYHHALRELLAGRDTIAEQYELLNGKGWAFNHKKTKAEAKEARLIDAAEQMADEGLEPDGGPAKYHNFQVPTIQRWLRKSRKRGSIETAEGWQPERGEATDEARLAAFTEKAIAAMHDPAKIKCVESGALRGSAAYMAKTTSTKNIERQARRIKELLVDPEGVNRVVTLVDQLPSAECEFPVLLNKLQKAFEGTKKDNTFEANSFCTALRWAAVALGLTDYPEGHARRWNLRLFVEELDSPAIQAAEAKVAENADAQSRIATRRAKRQAALEAALAAGRDAEDETPRRVRQRRNPELARAAAGDNDSDEAMEE